MHLSCVNSGGAAGAGVAMASGSGKFAWTRRPALFVLFLPLVGICWDLPLPSPRPHQRTAGDDLDLFERCPVGNDAGEQLAQPPNQSVGSVRAAIAHVA